MKEILLVSVLLCVCVVSAYPDKNSKDCPTCKLCPLDDKGCCFNFDGKMIPNGGSYNPNEVPYMGYAVRKAEDRHEDTICANFTCMNGEIKKKFYCPIGWDAIGTACYFVGSKKMHYEDAEKFCQEKGAYVQLAQLETKEKAYRLFMEIKQAMPEIDGDMEGVFWLGGSMYWDGTQYWNNPPHSVITDGYSPFKNKPEEKDRVAAYSIENHVLDKYWYYRSPYHLAYPLCQRIECSKPSTCSYKGKEYKCGEVMWRDPKCECSWIECGSHGEIKAVQKKKPCCVYDGEVYDDGADVFIDKCSKLVCKKGKLVSFPYCGNSEGSNVHWTPLTYNGSSSCYYFSWEAKTYDEASRFCAKHDSKLAEITSEGENEAVENWMINNYFHRRETYEAEFWLGGRAELCDNGKLGHFHWTSAESRKLPVEAVYEDFCDNKPCKDTSAHCLYSVCTKEKDKNYFCWANGACKRKKYFLCEKCASCEQIYKNVCYRYGYYDHPYMNGALVDAGHLSGTGYGGSCYEQHCENGKIIQRNFVCGDEYKQVTPEVRIKQANPAADQQVVRENSDKELSAKKNN